MFVLESEMIPLIRSGLPMILGNPISFAQANELPVNNRVIDIAAAPIDKGLLTSYEAMCKLLNKLSMVQLDVLSLFVGRRSVSIQYLSKQTFKSAMDLHNNFLEYFIEYGLVERTSRFTYEAANWVEALPPHIVAIEAKLNKWQEALEQAVSNKLFARTSLVILAKQNLAISRSMRDNYAKEGIGLLVVDNTGDIEEIVAPRTQRKPSNRDTNFQLVRILRDLYMGNSKSKWQLTERNDPSGPTVYT